MTNWLRTDFDFVRDVFKGPVKHFVLPAAATNWTETGVGGGTVNNRDPFRMSLKAIGINSSIIASAPGFGLNTGSLNDNMVDWTKRLLFLSVIVRNTSDAQAVSYMQIKEASTIGQVAARGIEIRASNLTLEGFAYGTSLSAAMPFLTNLTDVRPVLLGILLTAAGVEFFLDGVSQGTITTAGKFPAVAGTVGGLVVFSHQNGAVGTTSYFFVGGIHIFQEV